MLTLSALQFTQNVKEIYKGITTNLNVLIRIS